MKRIFIKISILVMCISNIANAFDIPNTCAEFSPGDYKTKYLGATSSAEYCESNPQHFLKKFCVKSGRMGMSNEGGFLGLPTGVCWWHSEFHRKMNYLTYYNPKSKSPYTDEEFKKLLKKIDHYKVTEIKGYKSFEDLVTDKKFPQRSTLLRKFLQTQLYQATFDFGWIKGLEGKPNRAAFGKHIEKQRASQLKEIKKVLVHLKTIPEKMKPVYMMVQYPWVVAHAYIVYEIEEIKDQFQNAYRIRVQDSNYQDQQDGPQELFFDVESAQWFKSAQYKMLADSRKAGNPLPIMRSFSWDDIRSPIPHVSSEQYELYVQRSHDLERINESFREFCGKYLFSK